MLTLDHLAIVASDLETGTDWAADRFGVDLIWGGSHDVFGTHNTLLGMRHSLYLEVISPEPEVEIDRPRWFDLDNAPDEPRLGNWICAVDNLEDVVEKAPYKLGNPVEMRRGALNWRILVPDDGGLPMGGAFPTLIEWGWDCPHPSQVLPHSGVSLRRLTVSTPRPAEISGFLGDALSDSRIKIVEGELGLSANFMTRRGAVAI